MNTHRATGRASKRVSPRLVGVVVLLLVAGGAVFGQQTLVGLQTSFRQIAKDVLPAVVQVDVVDVVEQRASRFPFFPFQERDEENSQPREFRREGLGSGVMFRQDGETVYVVTNYHVVGNADEIRVALDDGRGYPASLLGSDERRDIAVLSLTTDEELPMAEFGNSDALLAGDWVVAIGNPLGFQSTITAGIVSAVGRTGNGTSSISPFTDYIQTDAAINRGNSGGALVDLDGRVVGINTWIASPSGGNIGIGFAIPINVVDNVIDQILEKGEVAYAWLGVTPADPPEELREAMELGDADGAFIRNVIKDSPADRAGLRPGDFITALGSTDIKDAAGLLYHVGNLAPDSVRTLRLIREGRATTVRVPFGERQPEEAIAELGGKTWPGMMVMPLTDEIREQADVDVSAGDVIIVYVEDDTPAGEAGLHAGDVLTRINNRKVDSVMEFYRIVSEANRTLTFDVLRSGTEQSIRVRP